MKLNIKICKLMAVFGLAFLASCGGSGDVGTGTLSVGLTDAPSNEFSEVRVTIDEIQVHRSADAADNDSGWITIPMEVTPLTVDLLNLRDGFPLGLGQGPLEAGHYTQFRLILGTTAQFIPDGECLPPPFPNYVRDLVTGEAREIVIPSGFQTGLKIICPANLCTIEPDRTTNLIIDFDVDRALHETGSGKIMLQPTALRVVGRESFTIVTGTVFNGDVVPPPPALPPALPGTTVSAQIFDPLAIDPKDRVIVRDTEVTDINGDFEIFLRPGISYNIVAYHPGFIPAAVNFDAVAGTATIPDFIITSSPTGDLVGSVTIDGASAETFAHVSFQQDDTLPPEQIELTALDLQNGDGFSVNLPLLPTGQYDVVSSSCDRTTQVASVVLPIPPNSVLPPIILVP